MKVARVLVLILVGLIAGSGIGYGEIIYTEDGDQIQGEITEITADTIWVEIPAGAEEEMIEYIGIDRLNVQKILNDDGSKYIYPQPDKIGGVE